MSQSSLTYEQVGQYGTDGKLKRKYVSIEENGVKAKELVIDSDYFPSQHVRGGRSGSYMIRVGLDDNLFVVLPPLLDIPSDAVRMEWNRDARTAWKSRPKPSKAKPEVE